MFPCPVSSIIASHILYSFTVELGKFNNHYSVMTESRSPHFDKSEIAVFPTINIISIFKKYLVFTNLVIQRSEALVSTF